MGITRAKQRVYLVRAFRRHLMGSSTVNRPSRFLEDIPSELITTSSVLEGEDSWANTTSEVRDKTEELKGRVAEFKPGDHVLHEQFGEGVVVNYQKVKNDAEVVVAFDGEGVKRFLLSFAKIEKV